MAEPPNPQPSSPPPPFTYRRSSLLARFLCLAWMLFIAIEFSGSYVDFLRVALAVFAVVVWVTLWFFRCAYYEHRVSLGRQQPNRTWRHWCLEPATCVLGIVLAATGCLTSLRMHLSARAFEQYAQDLLQHRTEPIEPSADGGRWIGLYYVKASKPIGPNRVFLATESLLFRNAGFTYVPQGELLPVKEDLRVEHLFGVWWIQERPVNFWEVAAAEEKRPIAHFLLQWLSSLTQ